MADIQTSDSSSSVSRASSDSNLSNKVSDSELGAVGGDEKMASTSQEQCPTEDAISKLLEKQRNEIMFELRRLKMGDRPVTGQENKKTVEDFFNSRLNPSSEPPPADQHRPESVVVEVQGLVQTRPVSSILQSARFRRTLENAIRGGLSTLSSRVQNVSRPSTPQSQTAARTVSQAAMNVPPAPPIPPMVQQMRQEQVPLPPTLQSAAIQQPGNAGTQPQPSVHRSSPAQVPAPNLAPEVPGPARAQAWLQQVPHVDPREQLRMSVWENIEQGQRENIIMDISELVQAQLVTQTLSGTFRNTLEARMRDHVDSSGIDGQRVQEFLQTLPLAPHIRNDFSELGIQAPGGAAAGSLSDNIDNISVISATAAVQVQQTQSQALMSRELRSLKAQMQEMKTMMKMSFDMQLDIQRAIRQEVAAAIAANLGPTPQAPPRDTKPVDDTHCLICLDAKADTVVYQCGHLCMCYTCGMQLQNRASNCPVCRAPIKDIMRVYKAGHTQ